MALVYVPTPMRKHTNGQAMVEVNGATVQQVFSALEERYPGTRAEIYDDQGEIKRFVAVFVNGKDIRTLARVETTVNEQDEVYIVPAIAGGAR
ncbi:MAG TPA: ubiquitin-like small modifier protein 1 [Roseiflexaceae bacterium]|nr:ubiquitin-like small modifier protein 1 [Roseiflexaceae bacterium]